MMILPSLGLALAAAILQVAVGRGMGRRRLVGDEGEYLKRGRSDDPYGPDPFLRVPLMAWLARRATQTTQDPERTMRVLLAVAGWVCVLLTVMAATVLAGWLGGVLAGLLLLLQPERLILNQHIWPDTLIALFLAGLNLVLVAGLAAAWFFPLLGLLCLAAVLARIDSLAMVGFLYLGLWLTDPSFDAGWFLVWPILPTLIFLVLFSWRNYRRYRIALPDTTAFFNLAVMGAEKEVRVADSPGNGEPFRLDGLIRRVKKEWDASGHESRRKRALASIFGNLRRPVGLILGISRRLGAALGPDTFIAEKLFAAERGAYPELSLAAQAGWAVWLKLSFPLLASLTLSACLLPHGVPGTYAWPGLGLFIISFLFHTRTRYRLASMPAFCLVAGTGLARSFASGAALAPAAIPAWLAGAGLLSVLFLIPRRTETGN